MMSETIEGLRDKLLKWKEAFDSKGLNDNLGKTKIMVNRCIMQDGLSKSKVEPCGVLQLVSKG